MASGKGNSRRRGVEQLQIVRVVDRHWLIYIRQSNKKKDRLGQVTTSSIDDQERRCRKAIDQLDPEPASITVVVDHGRTGRHGAKRPGRDRVLELVESGQADAVMTLKAARIGRSIEESANFWNRCAAKGAHVAAADCPNLSSPIVRGVLFGMAEQEHEDRAEYSRAMIEMRRETGKPPIKTGVAYGLRWQGDQLARVPGEFEVVELAFKLFDAGVSIGAIARRLTKEKAPRRNADHGQWDGCAVGRILRCPWYVGRIPDGENDHYSTGQVFIDPELWERVQSRLHTIEDTGQRLHRALSGLLFCAECGGWSPMSLCYSRHRRSDGTVQQNDRYRCIHRVRDPEFCAGQSIRARDVEEFLVEQIQAVLGDDELAEARFERLRRQLGAAGDDGVAELDQRLAEIHGSQRELFERRKGGEVIPDFLYNEEMGALESERTRLQRKRDQVLANAGLAKGAMKRLRSEVEDAGPLNARRWFKLPQARRNEFLRLIFPHGIMVSAPAKGRRVAAGARLRVRAAAEVEAAEMRRRDPANAPDERVAPTKQADSAGA